jgi:hypothetical protein
MFRSAMMALTQDDDLALPTPLRRDILDHLYRKDAQGWSLCFDSPQREQLIGFIYQWADCHCVEVSERLTYLGITRKHL